MSGTDRSNEPTSEQLKGMNRDDLVRLGTGRDDVEIAYRGDRWPVAGTRAEKRSELAVSLWFVIAGLSAVGAAVTFLFWPWEFAPETDTAAHSVYVLYTPILGFLLGLSILAVGIGVIAFTKNFVPEEISVQQRHVGGSDEADQRTLVAELGDSLDSTGFMRRTLIKRSLGFGAGALGLLAIVPLGGLIKNPWAEGDDSALWVSGWTPAAVDPEPIYLRRDTGRPEDVVLVRPEDIEAGAIETVFPFRESEREDEEALIHGLRDADNPVMLVRLRPEQATQVIKRAGQEDFNYGDFYAYSKICTHAGCPASLYESQTGRLLCPCHQSQFDILTYAKPIFGPAARSLPQLPITVDDDGFFVAKGEFIEPVGPAFWERKS